MFSFILGLLMIVLWVAAIADILGSSRSLGEKIVLIILILAFPYLGPLVYMFVLREKK